MPQQFNIQQQYVLPTLYLCVLYLSENKQRLVSFISYTDWFLQPRWKVFTAQYELGLQIKQSAVFIWEQTATCATYSINWLVFIMEMKSVYCAAQTGSLNKAVCNASLKG